MSSLDTLIQLAKTRTDEQRQLLARLQAHLESVETAITDLELRKITEQMTVQENPDTALTYGDFIRWAIARGKELEKQHVTASAAIELARDKLAQMFEEQKRYELAAAARLEAERQEEAKRETQEMDEIGGESFRRKQDDN